MVTMHRSAFPFQHKCKWGFLVAITVVWWFSLPLVQRRIQHSRVGQDYETLADVEAAEYADMHSPHDALSTWTGELNDYMKDADWFYFTLSSVLYGSNTYMWFLVWPGSMMFQRNPQLLLTTITMMVLALVGNALVQFARPADIVRPVGIAFELMFGSFPTDSGNWIYYRPAVTMACFRHMIQRPEWTAKRDAVNAAWCTMFVVASMIHVLVSHQGRMLFMGFSMVLGLVVYEKLSTFSARLKQRFIESGRALVGPADSSQQIQTHTLGTIEDEDEDGDDENENVVLDTSSAATGAVELLDHSKDAI